MPKVTRRARVQNQLAVEDNMPWAGIKRIDRTKWREAGNIQNPRNVMIAKLFGVREAQHPGIRLDRHGTGEINSHLI